MTRLRRFKKEIPNKGILDFPENYHDLLQYVKIFVKRNLQNYFFYLVSVAKLTF